MSLRPVGYDPKCDHCTGNRPRDARGRFAPKARICLLYRIVRADFYAALERSTTYPRRFL